MSGWNLRDDVTGYYLLDDDGEPVPVESDVWSRRYPKRSTEHDPWRVVREQVGPYEVSTVFLGLDHGWGGGPPILWETLTFGPEGAPMTDKMERYTSRAAAERGHARMVEDCRASLRAANAGMEPAS